mgnify:CR=1 FL=1
MRYALLSLAAFAMVVTACGPPPSSGSGSRRARSDAGPSGSDAGNQVADAGQAQEDAGSTPQDTGSTPRDTGAPPVQNGCVAEGTGRNLQDKLSSLRLQNCNGDWVELHDSCGRVKAQMVLLVSKWCGACTQAMQGLRRAEDQYGAQGFDALYILGELERGVPATVERCAEVAREKGVNPDELLVDPGFQASQRWVNFCARDGRIGLPIQHALDGRNMQLRWSSMCSSDDVDPNAVINELMNAP